MFFKLRIDIVYTALSPQPSAPTKKIVNNQLNKIYDAFAQTYEENRGQFDMSDVLDGFYSTLNLENGKLLDLGCGAGEPVARYFTDHNWSVVGVDFSEQMIRLASKYAQEMQTMHADISDTYGTKIQAGARCIIYHACHRLTDKPPTPKNDHRFCASVCLYV